jgi:hypothetical protein
VLAQPVIHFCRILDRNGVSCICDAGVLAAIPTLVRAPGAARNPCALQQPDRRADTGACMGDARTRGLDPGHARRPA